MSALGRARLPACGACLVAAALVTGCGEGAGVGTVADVGRGGANEEAGSRPLSDASEGSGADAVTPQDDAPDPPDDVRVDAIVDDGFVRPVRDVGASDSTADGSGDPADASDAADAPDTISDSADVSDTPPLDVAELEDTGSGYLLAGTRDCLRYEIRLTDTDFILKGSDIAVTYRVQNECATPYRVRVEHFSDFFAIGIHRNGEPWVFMPDCPGTGVPYEYTFEIAPVGGGINRGWIWRAAEHEERIGRCGVAFDNDADYSIVGYGLTDLGFVDGGGYSEIFPMTDAIPITLRL